MNREDLVKGTNSVGCMGMAIAAKCPLEKERKSLCLKEC